MHLIHKLQKEIEKLGDKNNKVLGLLLANVAIVL